MTATTQATHTPLVRFFAGCPLAPLTTYSGHFSKIVRSSLILPPVPITKANTMFEPKKSEAERIVAAPKSRKKTDAERKQETRQRERDLCPPPIAEPNRRTP